MNATTKRDKDGLLSLTTGTPMVEVTALIWFLNQMFENQMENNVDK